MKKGSREEKLYCPLRSSGKDVPLPKVKAGKSLNSSEKSEGEAISVFERRKKSQKALGVGYCVQRDGAGHQKKIKERERVKQEKKGDVNHQNPVFLGELTSAIGGLQGNRRKKARRKRRLEWCWER